MPNLLQYVSSGMYFARIKVHGKVIRQSLKTDVWTTAKLRLVDFVKNHHQARGVVMAPTFSEAVMAYERELDNDSRMKPQSKDYRRWCLRKIKWTVNRHRTDGVNPSACRCFRPFGRFLNMRRR